jgi:predicted TIM-barrel fold metal-dependent hydrolase
MTFEAISAETILWSTDYPHHRCDWLESQRLIAEHMQGVPAREAAAMCAGNAARIYGLAAP